MSNAPEWVEPGEVADATPPPPSEREQLVASVVRANSLLTELINQLRKDLLRLDEIGAPVSRSRTRASKIEEIRADWWAHFDYDVIQGQTKGTRDQQARAERYELS